LWDREGADARRKKVLRLDGQKELGILTIKREDY
jgi:hypothetical protein